MDGSVSVRTRCDGPDDGMEEMDGMVQGDG